MISVKEFKTRIAEETERIAREHGWNLNNEVERGYAFQLFVADLIASYEDRFETAPEEAIQFSRDLGADLVFEDPISCQILICQCKYASLSKKSSPNETEVVHFFDRHRVYTDRQWVLRHGAERAALLLADYGEKVRNGFSVIFRFVTTAEANERVNSLVTKYNEEYARQGLPITCELQDFGALKDYYVRAISLELPVPDLVEFHLQSGKYFRFDRPYPTIVAAIKGNVLRDLYNKHKESLFAYNIRGYLGGAGVNAGIRETANNDPESFFYFNNGVAAICTHLELDESKSKVTARDFQVINGAQTIGALRRADPQVGLEVLFRLTQTENVKTIKGFNRDIIKFNNTQNVVKISDFRSNDPIQLWLEDKFKTLKATGPLPAIRYLRRREVGRRATGFGLRLEDFAKVRYAFLFEPTAIHAAPRSLWTHREDNGHYEDAFGVGGELLDSWSEGELDMALVALAFYLKLDRLASERSKKLPHLKRLRFHLLALIGLFIRGHYSGSELRSLWRSQKAFDEAWGRCFDQAYAAMDAGFERVAEKEQTLFAFVRSEVEWERMKSRFARRMSLATADA